MDPRIEEAKNGKRILYFVDGVHFVFGGILGSLWCFVRQFVKTSPGRQRLNVLGALNPFQKELLHVSNTQYINAETVCELLDKIHIHHKKSRNPITLVLDNARYQHCKKVEEYAKNFTIELLFLPPYSPNLNLIERLWKLIKKECLHSRYFPSFDIFSNTLLNSISSCFQLYPSKLESLLSLKFQIING